MNIPDKDQCYRLMCEKKMLDHIVIHSLQVCRVASCLADELKVDGAHLNRGLIKAAALLHDITKTRSFKTAENHALTGGQLLSDMGYPEVGDLVRQHVRLDAYAGKSPPKEAEIVNYADKRVLHDQVVSLEARMTYILKKYGKKPAHQRRIQMTWQKTKNLEKQIFRYLPFSPHDLIDHLTSWDISSEISSYQKICSRLSTAST